MEVMIWKSLDQKLHVDKLSLF